MKLVFKNIIVNEGFEIMKAKKMQFNKLTNKV